MTGEIVTEIPETAARGWSLKRLLITLGISVVVFIVAVVGAIAAVVGFFNWKAEMEKQSMENAYAQGMVQVQETFTEYLLENYEGVTAVEWEGVEVEWRDSPVYGPSLFGNSARSHFRVYVDDEHYFTRYLSLDDEMVYDSDLEKYVPTGTQTPANMDVRIENGLEQAVSDLGGDPDGFFSQFRKSEAGSPDASIVYDVSVFDFKY